MKVAGPSFVKVAVLLYAKVAGLLFVKVAGLFYVKVAGRLYVKVAGLLLVKVAGSSRSSLACARSGGSGNPLEPLAASPWRNGRGGAAVSSGGRVAAGGLSTAPRPFLNPRRQRRTQ